MKKGIYAILLGLTIAVSLAFGNGIVSAQVLGDDYPTDWKKTDGVDPWNMYWRQCTSFVAYRLSAVNGYTLPAGYGNAIQWGTYAKSKGIRVDMTPSVGAVAWFSSGVGGAGSYGHVSWVAEVSSDTVTLEEYNFDAGQGPEKYNKRTISKSQVSGYIHFRDVAESKTASKTLALAPKGTYIFSTKASVKNEAKTAAKEVATYTNGDSVNYDKVVEADGYRWISYISYSGTRRYIAVEKLTPKLKLAASGTYTITKKTGVKAKTDINSADLATYQAGDQVNYDKVLTANRYQWISYISDSGFRRYLAVEKSS